MEQIRSFIAIELPDELKRQLNQLQAGLKASGQSCVKWVNPYSIHITLKFLGSIAADMTDAITGVIAKATEGITPFRLEIKGTGVFPNPGRARVAWVRITGEVAQLSRLQERIESGLIPLGFPAESRPFTPHLTLARVREQASPNERASFGQLVTKTGFTSARPLEVAAISLMKSQLTREGAIYRRISLTELSKHG
ncbi:RNA 2',3'-cyclic phosphodiesterase [Chloroflexota bacterium]